MCRIVRGISFEANFLSKRDLAFIIATWKESFIVRFCLQNEVSKRNAETVYKEENILLQCSRHSYEHLLSLTHTLVHIWRKIMLRQPSKWKRPPGFIWVGQQHKINLKKARELIVWSRNNENDNIYLNN